MWRDKRFQERAVFLPVLTKVDRATALAKNLNYARMPPPPAEGIPPLGAADGAGAVEAMDRCEIRPAVKST